MPVQLLAVYSTVKQSSQVDQSMRKLEVDEAKEVVLAAHNGITERLRTLLESNPNLVNSVR